MAVWNHGNVAGVTFTGWQPVILDGPLAGWRDFFTGWQPVKLDNLLAEGWGGSVKELLTVTWLLSLSFGLGAVAVPRHGELAWKTS